MTRIELRDLSDDDRDAAYRAVRASASTWPRGRVADRAAFDAWVDGEGVTARAIVDGEDVVGLAATLDIDGDREALLAVTPDTSRESATEALRLLTLAEAERPLYACVAADDDPSHDTLAQLGFVEYERDGADIVYVLPPTLE
ncbi:hypothetical protein [Microbacterium sp. 1P10AE]|uniref:hypothetical protein n=1 Tax=Microbacterium sp. 1P10AE TaxID=3132286 RepID=UPI0039A19786